MAKRKKGKPINGWVIFDKPLEMTSTQAVGFVRYSFDAQKAGHGGTLDPLATGLLPIALGEATKTMPFILDSDKTYRFTVTFGQETNTDDMEGEVIKSSDKLPTRNEVEDALVNFSGEIEQTPPMFSAIKIAGQAAYKLARKGEEVEMTPRKITIHRIAMTDFTGSEDAVESATFTAKVSKGTYIRAIARDLGRILECYGYVSMLRRTQVGPFSEEQAVTHEKLDKLRETEDKQTEFLLDTAVALDDIPVYRATFKEETAIKNGGQLVRIHLEPGVRKMMSPDGRLISIIDVEEDGKLKVLRNFNL